MGNFSAWNKVLAFLNIFPEKCTDIYVLHNSAIINNKFINIYIYVKNVYKFIIYCWIIWGCTKHLILIILYNSEDYFLN